MNGEIIAVGTELLLGNIVNTNAQFLSEELSNLGINVFFQTVVGDNRERLEKTDCCEREDSQKQTNLTSEHLEREGNRIPCPPKAVIFFHADL